MTTAMRTDRRVARTRQMLQQAFHEIARERGFAATSVQEIAERANVNRGTFYAHYADKYALYDAIVREEFRDLLERTLPPASQWDRRTLRLLVATVLEYFAKRRRECHESDVLAPLTERATHEELTRLLLAWLQQGWGEARRWRVPRETIAQVMSWAIFGAAAQWCDGATGRSSEQMATDVLLVIMEGVAHLAPPE
jgi:AcrR family transcriptional regulator